MHAHTSSQKADTKMNKRNLNRMIDFMASFFQLVMRYGCITIKKMG